MQAWRGEPRGFYRLCGSAVALDMGLFASGYWHSRNAVVCVSRLVATTMQTDLHVAP